MNKIISIEFLLGRKIALLFLCMLSSSIAFANNISYQDSNLNVVEVKELLEQGEYEEAIDILTVLSSEYPENFIYSYQLGILLKDYSNDLENSIAYLEDVVWLEEAINYPEIHYRLGMAYLENKENKKARTSLSNYLKYNKDEANSKRVRLILGNF
ncbi:MAG: tetratricopeptide repeat protein, partial [Flavobacteriales bacterium]|nr:tetratricopeptide repeat protein [Flavobacteriales bacterium]